MKKKLLKLKTPNKKFNFKSREIRTPVNIEANNAELRFLLVAIKAAGVTDFSIVDPEEVKDVTDALAENTIEHIEDVIIEELGEPDESEPKTLLEKLANE